MFVLPSLFSIQKWHFLTISLIIYISIRLFLTEDLGFQYFIVLVYILKKVNIGKGFFPRYNKKDFFIRVCPVQTIS